MNEEIGQIREIYKIAKGFQKRERMNKNECGCEEKEIRVKMREWVHLNE